MDRSIMTWSYNAPGQFFGVDVAIDLTDDGRYQVRWGDQVANSWIENYGDPAVAFARVACLLRGSQTDTFFKHQATDDGVWTGENGGDGPAAFVSDADAFLNEQLEEASSS